MGYRKPASGSIEFDGAVISGLPTWRIAQLASAFRRKSWKFSASLPCSENLELPLSTRPRTGRPVEERLQRAFDIFPKLASYKERRGGQLSGGEKKMVSVARAVVLDPKLLLLDEPFEGLSPVVIPEIARGIAATRRATGLLAEVQHSSHPKLRRPHLYHRTRRDRFRRRVKRCSQGSVRQQGHNWLNSSVSRIRRVRQRIAAAFIPETRQRVIRDLTN